MFVSSRLRIMAGLAALAFSRLVMILYSFLLVPILLSAWGVHIYGEWVVLTAIASIASLSNVGFAQASNAEIIMQVAAGNWTEARRVYTTTLFSIGAIIIVVCLVAAIGLSFTDASALFGTHSINSHDSRTIVGVSLAGVVLSFMSTPPAAVISARHGAGPSNLIMAVAKVCELLGIIVLSRLGAGPVVITAVPVVMVVAGWVVMVAIANRESPWLYVSLADVDRNTLVRLMKPSLGMFLLYASMNIMAAQMPRVVVGRLGGAVVVALFSVTVTYVRTARVVTTLVSVSMQVELSRAFSEKNFARLEMFLENMCRVSFWMTLLATLVLIPVAPWAFHIWTHGKIAVDLPLVVLLSFAGLIGSYSDSFQILLSGINQVWTLAISHAVGIVIGIGFAIVFFPWLGVLGMAIGLALPEIFTATVGVIKAARIFSVSPARILVRSLAFPGALLAREINNLLSMVRLIGPRI